MVEGSQENDVIFDGMDVARKLYQQNLTPGQYALSIIEKGGEVPAFYASDLTNELKRIVTFQLVGNENLPADLLDLVLNKSRNATYYFFDKISVRISGLEIIFSIKVLLFILLIKFSRYNASFF